MRIMGITAAAVALAGLAACGAEADNPGVASTSAVQASNPEPDETMKETFVGCTWGEVTGSGLSIWAYACPQSGNTRLVADDSLPGFAMEGTFDGQTSRTRTIIVFRKAADAPIESVLPEVKAKSPGPHTAACVLARPTYDGVAEGIYHLGPTGVLKARWDAFSSGAADAEPMEPPCGDLGEQMVGDHVFYVLESDPTRVLYVNFGSEIQPFDAATLRPIAAD
jgi:hypothetical protein